MSDNEKSERRLPRDYYYRQEEKRRIDIENDRLGRVIECKRKRRML